VGGKGETVPKNVSIWKNGSGGRSHRRGNSGWLNSVKKRLKRVQDALKRGSVRDGERNKKGQKQERSKLRLGKKTKVEGGGSSDSKGGGATVIISAKSPERQRFGFFYSTKKNK